MVNSKETKEVTEVTKEGMEVAKVATEAEANPIMDMEDNNNLMVKEIDLKIHIKETSQVAELQEEEIMMTELFSLVI